MGTKELLLQILIKAVNNDIYKDSIIRLIRKIYSSVCYRGSKSHYNFNIIALNTLKYLN